MPVGQELQRRTGRACTLKLVCPFHFISFMFADETCSTSASMTGSCPSHLRVDLRFTLSLVGDSTLSSYLTRQVVVIQLRGSIPRVSRHVNVYRQLQSGIGWLEGVYVGGVRQDWYFWMLPRAYSMCYHLLCEHQYRIYVVHLLINYFSPTDRPALCEYVMSVSLR